MAGFKGMDKFIRWTEEVPNQLADEVKKVVTQNAHQLEANAKALTPVDTGHLRRSIITEVTDSGDSIVAEVGTNVEYAAYVEYGTSKQEAQPYLTPAFVLQKDKFLADMEKAMKKGLV